MQRMISPSELSEMFRQIGQCVLTMQYVEDVLHKLVSMKYLVSNPETLSDAELDELLAGHRKSPLGAAIKSIEKDSLLSLDQMTRLTCLKDERNWLVHHATRQNANDFYSISGRLLLSERLERMVSDAIALQKEISAELYRFAEFNPRRTTLSAPSSRQRKTRRSG